MNAAFQPIRLWVRLYTAGLPPNIRDDRRAEIESDLWEQTSFAAEHGLDRLGLAVSVWSRWLFGVADDLMWRANQRATLQHPRRAVTAQPFVRLATSSGGLVRLGAGGAIAIALMCLVVVVNTNAYTNGTQPSGELAATLLSLIALITGLGTITAVRGFRIMRARPADGAILVAVGSSIAGLAWYWLLAPVILALVISFYGVSRAMRLSDHRTEP